MSVIISEIPAIRVVQTKANSTYGDAQKKNYIKNRDYHKQRMVLYYELNKDEIRQKRMKRYYSKKAQKALATVPPSS